jgi:hypothetical protein
MDSYQLNTPVAFFIFNRPDTTARVFEAIRQARPPVLLVAADGYRGNRPGEQEKCAETRVIIEQVDWDCAVRTNYSETNIGVKKRISSALDWVFEQVEEAIIFEDDCLPHPSFFRYCEELLQHYRYDTRVMTISGDSTPLGLKRRRQPEASYHFSLYARIWGWATWRRAWKLYDIDMKEWSQIQTEHWLKDILHDDQTVRALENILIINAPSNWDCQWLLTHWVHHGLSIIPKDNLISNIGFSSAATNTTNLQDPRAGVPTQAMSFPLVHPALMIPDRIADAFTCKHLYDFSFRERFRRKFRKLLAGMSR